jgi:glycosyltransferase involved in cell wall biosynthesis
MILLEAAACEIPVIAFDVGGVREVLDGGPAEWLIKAGEMDSFGGAIATLLQNRQHAKSEAVRWAASVQARFSSRLVMSAYRAVYQAVAAGSS